MLKVQKVLPWQQVDCGDLLQRLEPFITHQARFEFIFLHTKPCLGV